MTENASRQPGDGGGLHDLYSHILGEIKGCDVKGHSAELVMNLPTKAVPEGTVCPEACFTGEGPQKLRATVHLELFAGHLVFSLMTTLRLGTLYPQTVQNAGPWASCLGHNVQPHLRLSLLHHTHLPPTAG